MPSLVARVAVVAAVVFLGAAGAAHGQSTGVNGVVQRVDVPARTVYLTDGRSVTLAPGARVFAGDRELSLGEIQPGWTLVTVRASATGPETVVDVAPPTATSRPDMPPIDATGVVSRVDAATGTITLKDGRVIHVTSRTTFWQPVPINALAPGAVVFVRNGRPLDFRPAASTHGAASGRQYRMGTVTAVDRANGRLLLTDGTIVHLLRAGTVSIGGRRVALGDVRPGDEVVVGLEAPALAAASPSMLSGASPSQDVDAEGSVDAGEIHVVRQAR